MLRESWKRPSILLFGWVTLLVVVFVFSGNLRVERPRSAEPAADAAREPVVVRAQRAARTDAPQVIRTARVFDATGFLVVGAELTVDGAAAGRTDADGSFAIGLASGRSADVTVQAPGHARARLRVQEDSPDPLVLQLAASAPWDLPPEPLPPLRFAGEGRILGSDGRPIAGARVTALGTESWARTDASGRYRLQLSDAMPQLAVQDEGDPGLAARSAPLQLERDRGVVPLPDLIAQPACALRGIVRDGNGVPVVGVPVRLRGEGLERLVETGSGGAFRIGGLEPGHYTLRPFAYRGMLGVPQAVTIDRALADCELALQPSNEQRLRVVDTAGTPIADAAVAPTFAGERTCLQRTDADGWTSVRLGEAPLGDAWAFEVRVGAAFTEPTSTHLQAEQGALVVALP